MATILNSTWAWIVHLTAKLWSIGEYFGSRRNMEPSNLQIKPSNSQIIYPNVPAEENDARSRINVMIDIYNHDIASKGRPDRGFFHEIMTAIHLAKNHNLTHGKHISRPLKPSEKSSPVLYNGNSQMVLVPMGNNFRELDIAYEENGRTCIVEAKNKQQADTSQLKNNVLLAQRLGGRVVYALPGKAGQGNTLPGKAGQVRALENAYENLPEAQGLPPLEVIHIKPTLGDVHSGSNWLSPLNHITTWDEINDSDFNPDDGGEP